MIAREQISDVEASTAYGANHEKIGKVGAVFVDEQDGTPEFATVRTGTLGKREAFVPLQDARVEQGELTVPYEADRVKEAPSIDVEQGHMSEQEEDELFRHYGLRRIPEQRGSAEGEQPEQGQSGVAPDSASTAAGTTTGAAAGTAAGSAAGQTPGERSSGRHEATSGSATSGQPGTADEAMTRSEEHLRARTEEVETGRARLRKHVVTEEEQVTVPVRKERAHVEREPITAENREQAMQGPSFTEAEHEMTLHEERPVVEKEEVPVERVRLAKDTDTSQEEVSEQVRKERIEEELPGEAGEEGNRS